MNSPRNLAEIRVERFLKERLEPAVYRLAKPLRIARWEAPAEPVSFDEAQSQTFTPFEPGSRWGRPWGTVWFHVTGSVPSDWVVGDDSVEVLIDLGFIRAQPGFQAEGLVWSTEGRIIKGLEPRNDFVPLVGAEIDFYIEAAANPDLDLSSHAFTPTTLGRRETAGESPLYRFQRADVAVRDVGVWDLLQDIRALYSLALELPAAARRAEIMAALDRAVTAVDPDQVRTTAHAARALLQPLLGAPATGSAHRVVAVGHAHIDSAWLWPVRETIRKCARTFSNVLSLMDDHPDFIFACSSAQQFMWMKEFYPELFDRIRARVAQGRFVPVGGMWVESDTNMPGGEALARQFIEGKQFFLDEFGVESFEGWLPDSFGFSAALPQILRAAGMTRFVTQKPSWNEVNAMPHSTFMWEGIDGSRVLTHLPPVNTYNSDLSGGELARAERNLSHKEQANTSLIPFGFGDGGGGPTREMIAAALRSRSLEGSPTVTLGSPASFFDTVEAEFTNPPTWVGEMYLEFHRGTYTSQAATKRGNRRSEHLLHEAELWAATAAVKVGARYPYEALARAWRVVLLQQFHDILPGSSIGWVHDQAVANYARVAQDLERLIADSLTALGSSTEGAMLVNSSPFAVAGIPAMGSAAAPVVTDDVDLTSDPTGITLSNGQVLVHIDLDGRFDSIIDVTSGRQVLPEGTTGNEFQLFRDTPTQWDAWDIDKEYAASRLSAGTVDSIEVTESTRARATVRIVRTFGSSRIEQFVSLLGGDPVVRIETIVDWHERQKLLKLSFPVDVHSTHATSEIQFGHIERATHTNTSWDSARFETAAHRWLRVADSGFGVAIANDSTYGHDVTRHPRAGGGSFSVIRESLLRAPLFPDPEADQGRHRMRTSLVVGDVDAAIREGYRINLPLREAKGGPIAPLLVSDNASIVIETVKLAQDESGDVVVRLYESNGARSTGTLQVDFAYADMVETDLLERIVDRNAVIASSGSTVGLSLDPFQLVTLRFIRA